MCRQPAGLLMVFGWGRAGREKTEKTRGRGGRASPTGKDQEGEGWANPSITSNETTCEKRSQNPERKGKNLLSPARGPGNVHSSRSSKGVPPGEAATRAARRLAKAAAAARS